MIEGKLKEDMKNIVLIESSPSKRITWFEVRAVNQESIHNHSAFAVVNSDQLRKQPDMSHVVDRLSSKIEPKEIQYEKENEKPNGKHFERTCAP